MEKLRHSTAGQKVLLGPFVSSTDLSLLTALTIQNTDIKISKHNASPVSKNSGGATHIGSGIYETTLDATDSDTVGTGQINVQMPGAMPVKVWFEVQPQRKYDQEQENTYYSIFDPVEDEVIVGTNNDKTGYELTNEPLSPADFNNALPANFKDLSITASTGRVTVGTNADKTGYTLQNMDVNVTHVAGTEVTGVDDFKSTPLTLLQIQSAVGTALADYNTAKVGSAMTLTSGERDAVAVVVESHLLDEGDSQPLIDAIVQAIGNTNVDELILVAAIRSELERAGGNLNTLLTRLTEDRAGFLDKLNVTGVLAHTNNADTFKANVDNLLTTATYTSSLPANFKQLSIGLDGFVSVDIVIPEPPDVPSIEEIGNRVNTELTNYQVVKVSDLEDITPGEGNNDLDLADVYLDKSTNPYSMVWIERGTGNLETGNVLLRKYLFDENQQPITSMTQAIANMVG